MLAGIRSYLAGWYFLFVFSLAFNAAAILGLMEFAGLDLLTSVSIVSAVNLTASLVFFTTAHFKWRRAVFLETELVRENPEWQDELLR